MSKSYRNMVAFFCSSLGTHRCARHKDSIRESHLICSPTNGIVLCCAIYKAGAMREGSTVSSRDMHLSELLLVFALLVLLPHCLRALRYSQGTGDENCETLKSEIHLIKEEFDELGRMQRTCNADVIVNKCEGLCNSQVQPSVITPTGFLKVSIPQ